MKIGIISDIHIDINKDYPILDEIIIQVNHKKLDALLIAGDISERVDVTINAIKKLSDESIAKIYYVPGNHDMWGKDYPSHSTDIIYQAYKNDTHCICEKEVFLSPLVKLFGNIGWYDYSFGDAKYSKADFDLMKHNERTWQDKLFSDWSDNNESSADMQMSLLEQSFNQNSSSYNILMTHMVSHEKFTVPLDWSTTIDWGYFNAFLGSRKLNLFCSKNDINVAIMGHVHYRGTYHEKNTLYICSCLNYHSEWQSDDYKKEVSDAMYILEI